MVDAANGKMTAALGTGAQSCFKAGASVADGIQPKAAETNATDQ